MGGGMGGGMGGMGGGMGGMGGGMGGGFMSVPPTGLPHASLRPNQTRHLPTRVVSLTGPLPNGRVPSPLKGEKLVVGEIAQVNNDPWAQAALKRLAEDKAPTNVAQLVIWHVVDGFDWNSISRFSRGWANTQEITLARRFAERLRETPGDGSDVAPVAALYGELTARDSANDSRLAELKALLEGKPVLGLTFRSGVPVRPEGPALACRIRLEQDEALVQLSGSSDDGSTWIPLGKRFGIPMIDDQSQPMKAGEIVDALAQGMLDHLANARLIVGPKVQGKPTYSIRIDNASPLILNGLALAGPEKSASTPPSVLSGISLPPHRSMAVSASSEMIERLNLKKGARLVAADFSDL